MLVLLSTVIGARTGPTAGAVTSGEGATLSCAGAAAEAAAELVLAGAVGAGLVAAVSSAFGEVKDQKPSTPTATMTTATMPCTSRCGSLRVAVSGAADRPGPVCAGVPEPVSGPLRRPDFFRAASAACRSSRAAARPPTGISARLRTGAGSTVGSGAGRSGATGAAGAPRPAGGVEGGPDRSGRAGVRGSRLTSTGAAADCAPHGESAGANPETRWVTCCTGGGGRAAAPVGEAGGPGAGGGAGGGG